MKKQSSGISKFIFELVITVTMIMCIYMMLKYFYFKNYKPLDLGTLSDAVIAISNAIMAIAAIYGVIAARNWLINKKNSAAFEHAIELMKELDSIKGRTDRIYIDFCNLEKHYTNTTLIDAIKTDAQNLSYDINALLRKFAHIKRLGIIDTSDEIKSIRPFLSDFGNSIWPYLIFFNNDSNTINALIRLGELGEKKKNLVNAWEGISTRHDTLKNRSIEEMFIFS